jgi:hypothetical protein
VLNLEILRLDDRYLEIRTRRAPSGSIIMKCYERHVEGFMRFAELADAIEKWLKETRR